METTTTTAQAERLHDDLASSIRSHLNQSYFDLVRIVGADEAYRLFDRAGLNVGRMRLGMDDIAEELVHWAADCSLRERA